MKDAYGSELTYEVSFQFKRAVAGPNAGKWFWDRSADVPQYPVPGEPDRKAGAGARIVRRDDRTVDIFVRLAYFRLDSKSSAEFDAKWPAVREQAKAAFLSEVPDATIVEV